MIMRTVLITGGTRGIGRQTAKLFKEKGFNVIANYLQNDRAAQIAESELGIQQYKCDVSDYDAVMKMYRDLKNKYGFIDTLVNNAGINHYKMFTDETVEDYNNVMDTNLRGAFNCCKAFCSDMISNKFGRIINVTSMWGQVGASMEVLYSVSKAGLIGLTKALAKELAPSKITVNAVSPGLIETEMNGNLSKSDIDAIVEETPCCRIGQADDVACAIYHLADASSSFITGQVIGINGGLIM